MGQFDLKTHIRDAKTGHITRRQPYRLHIKNGNKLFERPPGSGQMFYENGEAVEKESQVKTMPEADVKLTAMSLDSVLPETEEPKNGKGSGSKTAR